MRHTLLVAILACCSFCLSAQAYFCTEEGTDLVYVRRYVDDSRIKWIHTMTIGDVVMASDSSMSVEYSSCIERKQGRKMRPAMMTASINAGGDVTLDIASSMSAVLKGMLWNGLEVTAEGGRTVLPSDIAPGDTLTDARGKVMALGMTMYVSVTERKVIRTERLSTPAGVFDCVVVSEHKVEKGMMRDRETTALTWYARDIGMVRHDTYDKNMVLETSEVLERIERK